MLFEFFLKNGLFFSLFATMLAFWIENIRTIEVGNHSPERSYAGALSPVSWRTWLLRKLPLITGKPPFKMTEPEPIGGSLKPTRHVTASTSRNRYAPPCWPLAIRHQGWPGLRPVKRSTESFNEGVTLSTSSGPIVASLYEPLATNGSVGRIGLRPFVAGGDTSKGPANAREAILCSEGSTNQPRLTSEKKFSFFSLSICFIFLTCLLLFRWISSGYPPLSSLYESLLFLSWSFIGLYFLFIERSQVNARFQRVGFAESDQLAAPLGFVITASILFIDTFAEWQLPESMRQIKPLIPALQSNWLLMHVSIMILSYASLILGSIFSITYLILDTIDSWRNQRSYESSARTPTAVYYPPSAEIGQRFGWRWPVTSIEFSREANKTPTFDIPLVDPLEQRIAPRALANTAEYTGNQSFVAGFDGSPKAISKDSILQALPSNDGAILGKAYPGLPRYFLRFSSGRLQRQMAVLAYAHSSPKATGQHSHTPPKATSIRGTNYAKPLVEYPSTLGNSLDVLSYKLLSFGFPLLTLGILSGSIWANEAWGSYWSWDPKETWAFITWLVFAFYLHTRINYSWSGRSSAYVATFGFFIVWICYLGVNILGKGLHSYGWISS